MLSARQSESQLWGLFFPSSACLQKPIQIRLLRSSLCSPLWQQSPCHERKTSTEAEGAQPTTSKEAAHMLLGQAAPLARATTGHLLRMSQDTEGVHNFARLLLVQSPGVWLLLTSVCGEALHCAVLPSLLAPRYRLAASACANEGGKEQVMGPSQGASPFAFCGRAAEALSEEDRAQRYLRLSTLQHY